MSNSPDQQLEEDLLDLGSLLYSDLDGSIPSPGLLDDSPGDGEDHTNSQTTPGKSGVELGASSATEEPKHTNTTGDSNSQAGDGEAEGETCKHSDTSMEVDSEPVLRRVDSDVNMATVSNTDSDMNTSFISSSRNELETIFERSGREQDGGVFRQINTKPFGEHYHLALDKLLKIHAEFAHAGEFTKSTTWSLKIGKTRMDEVRQKSVEAYDELIQALFLDRKIKFRARSGESSESQTSPTPPTQTTPTQQAPAKGPSTEYSTTSSPETLKFACICESVHSAIFQCANAHAHKYLCEKKSYASVVGASNKQQQQHVPAGRRVLLATPVTTQPSTSPEELSRSRPITHQKTHKNQPNNTRRDTRSRSPNKRPSDLPKETGYQKHKREARERELKLAEAQRKQKEVSNPLQSNPKTQTSNTPISNLPTSAQIAKLMTDLGAGSKSCSSPPPPTRQPGKHGESALGPDGQVDFSRMPEPPPNMPDDLSFEVRVEANRWHVTFVKKH